MNFEVFDSPIDVCEFYNEHPNIEIVSVCVTVINKYIVFYKGTI